MSNMRELLSLSVCSLNKPEPESLCPPALLKAEMDKVILG